MQVIGAYSFNRALGRTTLSMEKKSALEDFGKLENTDNTTLKTLTINGFKDADAIAIASLLKVNKVLEHLNLDNCLGPVGAKHLADALVVNNTLTSLNLASRLFSEKKIGPTGAAHIAKALKVNKVLANLNLRYNRLGLDGVKHLTDALVDNTTLETLTINGEIPVKRLRDRSKTQTLNLSRRGYKTADAIIIASLLKVNKVLTNLDLQGNWLGPDGAKHLADALVANTVLQNLNLERNKLGPEGAKHLAAALTANTVLQNLNVRDNRLDRDGAKYFACALRVNMSLKRIDGVDLPLQGRKSLLFNQAGARTVATEAITSSMHAHGIWKFEPSVTDVIMDYIHKDILVTGILI